MGVLWVAEHRGLRSEVVVKFLTDELADDPSAAKGVAREAAAAARVRSPHVVQILDHGVADGAPFIVMERLEGRDLRERLRERGALSLEETTAIVRQLAKALDRTHLEDIVHRDIKPSNIFLMNDEGNVFVKLLDFGLAQHAGSADSSSAEARKCAGTPPYMSPEQITGGTVDTRSDIWSLGVVAFECLAGKRPFDGETQGSIAIAIHTLPFPRLTAIRADLPTEIDAWFEHVCARSPDERFASATEASEAMARALGTMRPLWQVDAHLGPLTRDDQTLTDAGARAEAPRDAGRTVARGASRQWALSLVLLGITLTILGGASRIGSKANAAPIAHISDTAARAPDPSPLEPTAEGPGATPVRSTPPVEETLPAQMPIVPAKQAPGVPARLHPAAVAPLPEREADAAPPFGSSFELPDERH